MTTIATIKMATRMKLSVGLVLAFTYGCGDNLTHVDRNGYQGADLEPLSCVPNLDGRIDANEVAAAIGVSVRYLVSPAGQERPVNVAGTTIGDGTLSWDWSVDLAQDEEAVIVPRQLGGQWYEGSFGGADAFVTPFDAGGRVESILRKDDEALWLLGLASADPSPAEGQTLLVYQQPVAVLRFPVQPGGAYSSVGVVENGTLRGLPYAGTDTYDIEVDAMGELVLPQLTFTQVHRVRQRVLVEPAVGAATSQRQVSYFFECFAEVARAVSLPDEEDVNFTTATEIRRLGFR
jgi:hypothetical protein